MRRGFIAWSKIELPEAVFEARLNRVRAAMARQELDALVLYTNNTRTAGVSWLTAFVPYWAEGLLVVPRQGEPLLAMAFSNRVVGWGKSVSRVARFEGFPRIGMAAGKYLAEHNARRVGVVDFDALRQAVAADLAAAVPTATLNDASVLFEEARAKADAAEIALAAHAGMMAQEALARLTPDMTLAAAIAAAEEAARLAGAEEVYMAASPDLQREPRFRRIEGAAEASASFAIRITLAYKGSWVRMTRTLFRDGDAADVTERAGERFAAAVAALPEVSGFAGFRSWLIEGCRLTQPLDPLLGSLVAEGKTPAPGSLATAQAVVEIEGRNVALAAPVLLGEAASPAAFLVPPTFAPR